MYRLFLACTVTCFLFLPVQSQNVGIGTATPNNNAVLDIQSTSKGILIPRMDSTTRKLIPNVPGLLVYDSTTKTLWQNTGIAWENYYVIPKGISNGDMLFWNETQWVRLPASTAGKVLTINGAGLPVWQNPAPLLHSIGVTPAAPSIVFGQTQQFTATGIYWDSTTANISSAVIWKSSNTSVATINSLGFATSTGAGSATITARSGVISGSTTLTVSNTGPVTMSINDVSLSEGSGIFVFQVSLSGVSGLTISVNFNTANGTASGAGAGADYLFASGSLTFLPGETSKNIVITINDDITVEPNETFFVNLSGAFNATIADGQGLGTILNDD
jgi:Calx-beta domain